MKATFLSILGRMKSCLLLVITGLESDTNFLGLLSDEESSSLQALGKPFLDSECFNMNYCLKAHVCPRRLKSAVSRS